MAIVTPAQNPLGLARIIRRALPLLDIDHLGRREALAHPLFFPENELEELFLL